MSKFFFADLLFIVQVNQRCAQSIRSVVYSCPLYVSLPTILSQEEDFRLLASLIDYRVSTLFLHWAVSFDIALDDYTYYNNTSSKIIIRRGVVLSSKYDID